MHYESDVFVIGGGPAGLAAAIAARRKGLSVIVADGAIPPVDKACGEGLMPDALAAARATGVEIPASAGYPFDGIRFCGTKHSVTGMFPEGNGVGVRRTVLHALLADAAVRAGVELRWASPVGRLDAVRARWVVGADGGQSLVRRWAGLDGVTRASRRFGFRKHFQVAPWSRLVEIYWGRGCQFYVTPVAPDEVCVVLMSRDPHLRIADALEWFPELNRRLAGQPAGAERGHFAATCRLGAVARGRVALVGDAAGTVDAITGGGLCLAFQQAAALADALAADNLPAYAAAHRAMSRRPVWMADWMLMLDCGGVVQSRALAAMAARPELFGQLVAAHVGKRSAAEMVRTGVELGWRMVTA